MDRPSAELKRVRLASRAAALVCVGLLCLLGLRRVPALMPSEIGEGATAVGVLVAGSENPHPQVRQPRPRFEYLENPIEAEPTQGAGGGGALDLWIDEHGRTVFDSEQKYREYRRCLDEARANHRDDPACASAAASTPLTLTVPPRPRHS